jgi:hypothetical protein
MRLGQKSGLAAAIFSLAIPGSLDQAGAIDLNAGKDDAQTVNILTSCASDIMLSKVQFELNMLNLDKIRRLFPGMKGNGNLLRLMSDLTKLFHLEK